MSSMIGMTKTIVSQNTLAPPVHRKPDLVHSFSGLNFGSATRVAGKTAITNVRVFDGHTLSNARTVVIDGDHIGVNPVGATIVNGNGGVLIPGLIDAHIHIDSVAQLEQMRSFGVTTGLDMEAWPPELVYALRQQAGQAGLPDMRTAILAAMHNRVGMPPEGHVENAGEAVTWVADQISFGADYIKIISDQVDAACHAGFDQDTLNALVSAAHQFGKFTVAHATALDAVRMSQRAGVDMLTHTPLGDVLSDSIVQQMARDKTVFIPTLIMMKQTAAMRPPADLSNASASVTTVYKSKVPILAGTDANCTRNAPIPHPTFGESMHDELDLLVKAGLSNVDALRAATILPAQHFGLWDRGVIAPGRRADLVLLTGNPLENISATRSIKTVWCGGVAWNK